MSGFFYLASVGGSWIDSLLLSNHVYLLNGLSIACYALTACVSVTVPSYCGLNEQNDESSPLIQADYEGDQYDNFRPSLDGSAVLSHRLNARVNLSSGSVYVPMLTLTIIVPILSLPRIPKVLARILPYVFSALIFPPLNLILRPVLEPFAA